MTAMCCSPEYVHTSSCAARAGVTEGPTSSSWSEERRTDAADVIDDENRGEVASSRRSVLGRPPPPIVHASPTVAALQACATAEEAAELSLQKGYSAGGTASPP